MSEFGWEIGDTVNIKVDMHFKALKEIWNKIVCSVL